MRKKSHHRWYSLTHLNHVIVVISTLLSLRSSPHVHGEDNKNQNEIDTFFLILIRLLTSLQPHSSQFAQSFSHHQFESWNIYLTQKTILQEEANRTCNWRRKSIEWMEKKRISLIYLVLPTSSSSHWRLHHSSGPSSTFLQRHSLALLTSTIGSGRFLPSPYHSLLSLVDDAVWHISFHGKLHFLCLTLFFSILYVFVIQFFLCAIFRHWEEKNSFQICHILNFFCA